MEKNDSAKKKTHYTGRGGYHGGGRKATGIKRKTMTISGQPEELAQLKKLAAENGLNVSRFILLKTGVIA